MHNHSIFESIPAVESLNDEEAARYSGGASNASPPSITLFERRSLRGDSDKINRSTRQLSDFNDLTSSLVIRRGVWVLYKKPNYKGLGFIAMPGKYANLPSGLNNKLSSLKRIG